MKMDFKITQTTLNALSDLIKKQEEWTNVYGHALDDNGEFEKKSIKQLWKLYKYLETIVSKD